MGAGAFSVAAIVLAGASLLITIRHPAVSTGALLFGALAWLTGNILWLTGLSVPELVGWWIAFLVLTVAAERLALSRLMPRRRGSDPLLLFAIGLLLAGAQNGLMTDNGAILFGLALLATTLWLTRHDIAFLNIRRSGQPRFMAICMVAGYGWLTLAGLVLIGLPPGDGGSGYDIALHAILIGFVLSMVFGHALIILPAIAGVRLRYSPLLYAPLLLLHASLLLRFAAGIADWESARLASGLITLLAVAGFAASLAPASRAGHDCAAPPPPLSSEDIDAAETGISRSS